MKEPEFTGFSHYLHLAILIDAEVALYELRLGKYGEDDKCYGRRREIQNAIQFEAMIRFVFRRMAFKSILQTHGERVIALVADRAPELASITQWAFDAAIRAYDLHHLIGSIPVTPRPQQYLMHSGEILEAGFTRSHRRIAEPLTHR